MTAGRLTVGIVVLGLLLGVVTVLYQIMKQQGRMLLRIDELERVVQGAVGGAAAAPVGPPLGSAVEPFTMSDLDGNSTSLADFAGRRLLLVNWSPTCGYCDMIADELASFGPGFKRANTELILLARGDAQLNRANAEQHGLVSAVFLLGNEGNPVGFRGLGTPAAVLVDEAGRVASPLVVGADQVPVLAREIAAPAGGGNGTGPEGKRLRGQRPLNESRLLRDGLKPGTRAPLFDLPDIHGSPVILESYRGRRVLLTFTDPDCGPCEALLPQLVRTHAEYADDDLAVVVVGRGDPEANRRKAEEHGFQFPVVLQEGWKLSKEYGIFLTPVAFLIDEGGIIARDVAKGVDEIVALLRSWRS